MCFLPSFSPKILNGINWSLGRFFKGQFKLQCGMGATADLAQTLTSSCNKSNIYYYFLFSFVNFICYHWLGLLIASASRDGPVKAWFCLKGPTSWNTYVLSQFTFLTGKTRDRYKEGKYPENMEKIVVCNTSPLEADVSFCFQQDSTAATFILDPPSMKLKPGESQVRKNINQFSEWNVYTIGWTFLWAAFFAVCDSIDFYL